MITEKILSLLKQCKQNFTRRVCYMNKQEVLEKSQSKKAKVGEMKYTKIGKGNLIAIIVAGVLAIAFMIIGGIYYDISLLYMRLVLFVTLGQVYFILNRKSRLKPAFILFTIFAIFQITILLIAH